MSSGASSASTTSRAARGHSASAPHQSQQPPVADIPHPLHSETEELQRPRPTAEVLNTSSESGGGESDTELPPSGAHGDASAAPAPAGGKACAFCFAPLIAKKRKDFGRYCGMSACKCEDYMTCEHKLVCKRHGEFFINGIHWLAADPANATAAHNEHCDKVNKCPGCRVRDINRCKEIGMLEETAMLSSPRRKTKPAGEKKPDVPGAPLVTKATSTTGASATKATWTTGASAMSTPLVPPPAVFQRLSSGQDHTIATATGFLVSPDPIGCRGASVFGSSSSSFSLSSETLQPQPQPHGGLFTTSTRGFTQSNSSDLNTLPLTMSRTTRPYIPDLYGDDDPEHKRPSLPELGNLSSFLDGIDQDAAWTVGGALKAEEEGEEGWTELAEDDEGF